MFSKQIILEVVPVRINMTYKSITRMMMCLLIVTANIAEVLPALPNGLRAPPRGSTSPFEITPLPSFGFEASPRSLQPPFDLSRDRR